MRNLHLEIPSYAKPMKPEISDVKMPTFSFLLLGNFGKPNEILYVKMLCTVQLNEDICSL